MNIHEQPTVDVYRGIRPTDKGWAHVYSRDLSTFEAHMKGEISDYSPFGITLRNQLEQAKRERRANVVVVDLGAGEGNFTREFLSDGTLGQRSRIFLAANPELSLIFYSVTDATSSETFGQQTDLLPFDNGIVPGNRQIKAKNVQYSITSSQSVKQLVETINTDSLDIVVASNFMQYLHPRLFDTVMRDTIDVLKPGGQMFVYGYTGIVGSGLSKDDKFEPQDEPILLRDPLDPSDEGVMSDVLQESAINLVRDSTSDYTTLLSLQTEILRRILYAGVLTSKEWDAINTSTIPLRQKVAIITDKVLSAVVEEVHLQVMQREKAAILQALQAEYHSRATITCTENALRVKKS